MSDIYVYDFSGGEEERARRQAKRAAERARIRARYTQRVGDLAGVDDVTAELVMSALFDHFDVVTGEPCTNACHPTLPDGDNRYGYDDGFNCRCQWSPERRREHRKRLRDDEKAFWASPDGVAIRAHEDAERAKLDAWLSDHAGVEARQTSEFAPEQWEGSVDGRSFRFRERMGEWSIELDVKPDGRFVNRLIGTGDDGEMITEAVETTSGTVIAEGHSLELGTGDTDRLVFIVRTVREHIADEACTHAGMIAYCPICGKRAS